MICPKCKTDQAHRSHREGWKDYVVSFFDYYPYLCKECKHRFFQVRHAPPKTTGKPNSTETKIRATRSRHVWRRKRREFLLYGWALVLVLVLVYFITRDHGVPSDGT